MDLYRSREKWLGADENEAKWTGKEVLQHTIYGHISDKTMNFVRIPY